MYATIYRATNPCARCRNCGSERQYHGRPGRICLDFVAETMADIDPGDLSHIDLMRHCVACDQERDALVGKGDFTPAESARLDWLKARIASCREELADRIKAVFGTDIADVAGVLGLEVIA